MSLLKNIFGTKNDTPTEQNLFRNEPGSDKYQPNDVSGVQVMEVENDDSFNNSFNKGGKSNGETQMMTASQNRTPIRRTFGAQNDGHGEERVTTEGFFNQKPNLSRPQKVGQIKDTSPIFSAYSVDKSNHSPRNVTGYVEVGQQSRRLNGQTGYRNNELTKSTDQVANQHRIASNRQNYSKQPRTPQPKRNIFNRAKTFTDRKGNGQKSRKRENELYQSVFLPQTEQKIVNFDFPKSKIGLDPKFEKELELVELSFKGSTNSKSPQKVYKHGMMNNNSEVELDQKKFKNFIGFGFSINKIFTNGRLVRQLQALKHIKDASGVKQKIESQRKLINLLNCHYFKKIAFRKKLDQNKAFQRWKVRTNPKLVSSCYREIAIKARIHWQVAFWRMQKIAEVQKKVKIQEKIVQENNEQKRKNKIKEGLNKLSKLKFGVRNNCENTIQSFNVLKKPLRPPVLIKKFNNILEPILTQNLMKEETLRQLANYGYKRKRIISQLMFKLKAKQLVSFLKLKQITSKKLKKTNQQK